MRKLMGYVLLFMLSGVPFGVGVLGGPSRWDTVTGFLLWLALTPLFFIGATLIGRWTGIGGLRELGLGRHRGWGRNLGLGLLLGLAQVLLFMAVWIGAGVMTIQGMKPLAQAVPILMVAVFNYTFVSLSEELVERGYLLQALPQRWGPALRVGVGAAIFMLGHIPMQGHAPQQLAGWLIMGVAFAVPYLVTGSLWFSVGVHFGVDTFGRLLTMTPGILLLQGGYGPDWLDWAGTGTGLLALLALPLVLRLAVRAETPATATDEEASA